MPAIQPPVVPPGKTLVLTEKGYRLRKLRGDSKFWGTDIAHATRAALMAGLSVRAIEVDPVNGLFTVLTEPIGGQGSDTMATKT